MEEIEIDQFKVRRGFKAKIRDFFANPKKRLWFIVVLGLVLIASVGLGLYFLTRSAPVETTTDNSPTLPKTVPAAKYYGILDGVETDQQSADNHPLGIMVENHIDARPQAGLDKSSIVYEAIAEGGITRFLAVFGSHSADKVGPVRSARTYFVNWALGYNAYLAHVGGNYDALQQIIADSVLDLDQFKHSSSYWRVPKTGVASEHTMFTSTLKLREQAALLKYNAANDFRLYKFVDISTGTTPALNPSSGASVIPATEVKVNFSSANYNVVFQYDAASNRYKRVVSGKVQLDSEDKAEIAPTNLVVMTVKRSTTVTKINELGWNMDTVGSGSAKVFMDGKVIEATWQKNSKTDREVFYDKNNQEITFNRGQFWICVIPPDSTVTF